MTARRGCRSGEEPPSLLWPQAVRSREVLFGPVDVSSWAPRPALLLSPGLGGGAGCRVKPNHRSLSYPGAQRRLARDPRAPTPGMLHGPSHRSPVPPSAGQPSGRSQCHLPLLEPRAAFWVAKPRSKPHPGGGDGRQSGEEERQDVFAAETRATWPEQRGRGGDPRVG